MELNKRKKSLLIKYIVIGVLCLALGFGSGYLVFHNSDASAEDKTNMTVVDEVVELLNNNWLDTTDSKTSIQDRMIAGLVDGLGDSHSSYMSTQENKEFNSDINGNDINSNKIKRIKRKRKNSKVIWTVIMFIFIFIALACVVKLIFWNRDNKKTSSLIDNISSDTMIKEVDDSDSELVSKDEDKNSDYWYYITFPLIDVDISKLKSKNSDTVGWINVNNTNINYPFVHYKDNDFYLNHSYDKSYNEAGWVFMDYRNNINLDNKNTILYAHSRLDKTMFGSLSKTLNSSWFTNRDNHIIRLSMEKENTMWQIFSVYKIPEESYYITTKFNSDTDYTKFLDTIKNRSIYNFKTKVTAEDKILTLSTCYSDTERTVVHAKLIKRSKN